MLKEIFAQAKSLNLTEGNVIKNIWALTLPMMLGNILQTSFNVVDMIWVGRLGAEAIAAVAMGGVVLMVVITFIIGIATGTLALIARQIGAKDLKSADHVAMQSLIIGGVLSLVLAVMGIIFARPILQALGAKAAVLELGTEYLKIILMGGLMMVYLFLANAILRGAGDALTPMFLMIAATVLNIILDPLMIFGIGFPPMGVNGAALATVLSRGLAAVAGLYLLFQGRLGVRLHLSKIYVDFSTILRIIKIGFPNSIQMALRSVVGLVLMTIVAGYGQFAVAAYGIGLRIFSVVLMPGFALAGSAATLVGQNLGANKLLRAETSARSAAHFNSLMMGLAGIIFFVFSAKLVSVFSPNPDIIRLGSKYLRITSFGYIFIAQGLVLGRSLMGAGDTISPMLIALLSLLGIQIPLALLLPSYRQIGIEGIWWAILFASVLQGLLTI
ncbi:MAG: MATE family efflux transporter, partial [Candidatus Omnitrophica bacterium]|nr:MATE family efflux transporter [Candidatus Omnitrophota bacterium]